MASEMREIPEDARRFWETITIDGEERRVGQISFKSSFGTLTYGWYEGCDRLIFRERGGSVVTLPYTSTPKDELLVGLLHERRPNMGEKPVWCVISGSLNPPESSALVLERPQKLAGMDTNPHPAFFAADADKGEGVQTYAQRIPFGWFRQCGENYVLRKSALLGHANAGNVSFFPWRKAIQISPDGRALAAIARLVATLI